MQCRRKGLRSAGVKSNKFWLVILGGVVVLAAVVAMLLGQVQSSYAFIHKDGALTDTVNLSAVTVAHTIDVVSGADADGSSDIVNVLEVEQGRIRMLYANCPDGTCIRQGWNSGGITPIVCLPNRVVVTFDGTGSGADVDAVVG